VKLDTVHVLNGTVQILNKMMMKPSLSLAGDS